MAGMTEAEFLESFNSMSDEDKIAYQFDIALFGIGYMQQDEPGSRYYRINPADVHLKD